MSNTEKNPLETTEDWKKLFDQVNEDESKEEEGIVVGYDDVEFYSQQIYILTNEEDFQKSEEIAKELSRKYS